MILKKGGLSINIRMKMEVQEKNKITGNTGKNRERGEGGGLKKKGGGDGENFKHFIDNDEKKKTEV